MYTKYFPLENIDHECIEYLDSQESYNKIKVALIDLKNIINRKN